MLRKQLNPAPALDIYSALFLAQAYSTNTSETNQQELSNVYLFAQICSYSSDVVCLCNGNSSPSLHVCLCKLVEEGAHVFCKLLVVNLHTQ